MKVALITTDNRTHFRDYNKSMPYFGTAPDALIHGFSCLSEEVEVHVISVARETMLVPSRLAPNIHFHQPVIHSWGMGRSLFAGAVLAIRNLLLHIQPDIVHGQGTERECALAAAFSGYPNVITIHGNMKVHASRGENRGKFYYKLAALLEDLVLRRTDGVVSISSYTDALVKPIAAKTWLLPNATEGTYFDASPSPDSPPTILFIGGFDERKNPVGFIRACGDLISRQGWRLRLCGSGDPRHPYVKELNSLAVNNPWIELAGWKSRGELLAEIERASILVLPTLEDNCPMVVLEAMAAGLPVIASAVGGVPDLISDGRTGLLFNPLDPDSMRSATARMMECQQTRETIRDASRLEAKMRFHPKVVAEKHLQIYREVLQSRT